MISSMTAVQKAHTQLEVALLVLLCSPESELSSMASNCFAHLCAEVEIIGIDDSRNILAVVENLEVYKELTSTDVLVIGRAAQQKRIRKLLRLVDKNTDGPFHSLPTSFSFSSQIFSSRT